MGASDVKTAKCNYLFEWLNPELKNSPVSVEIVEDEIHVNSNGNLVIGITVSEESYRIYNVSQTGKSKTTYHCEPDDDGTWYYYVESVDECIEECKRQVIHAIHQKEEDASIDSSELRTVVTEQVFENAYKSFMEQAEKNALTKKAQGTKTPYGMPFGSGRNAIDGHDFTQHFGQGAASVTPYMNWHVVSIYYIVSNGRIIVGIEKDRYPKVSSMSPIKYEQLGNRKNDVAIFYETNKAELNYSELYERFVCTSEDVMKLSNIIN